MNAVTPTEAAGPAAILTALCKAMGQVQKVAKEGRNKHDGYDFASIDDFLALVNPICAENGLIVHMQEGAREDFERQGKNGVTAWMRQSFNLTLYHVSGESLPPVTRTVEVLRNGAQAYGSAQSYALKQFWRAILLIPTGDKDDADFHPTDGGPVSRGNRADPPREPRPDPVQTLIDAINAAPTLEALVALWREHAKTHAAADPRAIKAKDDRKAALTPPPADPAPAAPTIGQQIGDEIPY